MNIYNYEKLECISPAQIENYLNEHGWRKKIVVEEVSVWIYKRQDRIFGLFLPLNINFVDYRNRVVEILDILQKAEKRSQEEILKFIEIQSNIVSP
ncbi:hypothetical protein NIES4071_22110 [Calothrix sp. NIES-4071]|nr:hypothetical protein NIES4071_22110 [Calothrix sp. NIES-4071]BAZ56543.1 hypothetical protein NIES4105_22060 [Calothrix sp. NIES-4105]